MFREKQKNQDELIKQTDFNYQLVDTNGKVIKSEDVAIKDMSFMTGSNFKYRQKSLSYEKKMIDDWFFETFKGNLTAK